MNDRVELSAGRITEQTQWTVQTNFKKAILNKDVIISKFQEPMKTKQCTSTSKKSI